jgi:hypothetical protein
MAVREDSDISCGSRRVVVVPADGKDKAVINT